MHRLNISYKQFYVPLNEIWLFESDPNAPSTWSEPGGKQWQRSIRGRRNWDVELGPCAVIRHLCAVAFVWETKRPQADNSRSLIDRQVSCLISIWFFICDTHKMHPIAYQGGWDMGCLWVKNVIHDLLPVITVLCVASCYVEMCLKNEQTTAWCHFNAANVFNILTIDTP